MLERPGDDQRNNGGQRKTENRKPQAWNLDNKESGTRNIPLKA